MTRKIKKTEENISKLPSHNGNYNLYNKKGEIIDTSQENIKQRISEHERNEDKHFTEFTHNLESSGKKRVEIEEKRIKKHDPPFNKQKK
jgi:hypothetical protein